MISPVTGKLIHHNDCSYCRHRRAYPKAIEKKYELELCDFFHGGTRPLPHPRQARRYCAHYQQIGCDCQNCISINTHV